MLHTGAVVHDKRKGNGRAELEAEVSAARRALWHTPLPVGQTLATIRHNVALWGRITGAVVEHDEKLFMSNLMMHLLTVLLVY